MSIRKKYDIAAYVWPSYTGDEPRTRMFWPDGIGEWQTVKNAVKKFPLHNWPRKPLWGYVNEADPQVMEMEVEAAADNGVNVFIYDWYWYDRRPFLENCLNDGFLKAKNNSRMKFYLMWANHDALPLWDIRMSDDKTVIWQAAIDRNEFEKIAVRLIEKYFKHDLYYKIDGKPVFMIYDTANLIKGLGSVKAAADALEWLRNECVRRGLNGIHLQSVSYGAENQNLSGLDDKSYTSRNIIKELGFNSITHYQYCHFADIDRGYNDVMNDVLKEWGRLDNTYDIPYFPHVSLGWDNNPRFRTFKAGIMTDNTTENIKKALIEAKGYADRHENQPPLITINSWNEWTESSYLEPDDLYGCGYLEAIKEVFM